MSIEILLEEAREFQKNIHRKKETVHKKRRRKKCLEERNQVMFSYRKSGRNGGGDCVGNSVGDGVGKVLNGNAGVVVWKRGPPKTVKRNAF